jgi:hypothetical protein
MSYGHLENFKGIRDSFEMRRVCHHGLGIETYVQRTASEEHHSPDG